MGNYVFGLTNKGKAADDGPQAGNKARSRREENRDRSPLDDIGGADITVNILSIYC